MARSLLLRITVALLASALLFAACTTDSSGDPAGGPSTSATAPAESYVEAFEFVWATVDDEFYDPGFGGVDWAEAHDRYLPLAIDASTDLEFVGVANTMLWELGVSHLAVLPAGEENQVDPILTSEGWLGLDIRLLDGEAVVTHVEPGSAAAAADMRLGDVLRRVDEVDVADIVDADLPMMPPLHERGQRSTQTNAVRAVLYGEPGSSIALDYRDGGDTTRTVTLEFDRRTSVSEIMPGLPPAFTHLQVDRLDGGIGYLAFNAFVPALTTPIVDALDEMADAPGIIIDLRGNHGGVFDVRSAVINELVAERSHLWTYVGRHGSQQVFVEPADEVYEGPIVVLVDVLSASSAEEFAGALQAIGRATVIGERTAGRVLIAEVVELPIGGLMMYPAAKTVVADGTTLESHGVIPDVAVDLTRAGLQVGTDAPLQAAIDLLASRP